MKILILLLITVSLFAQNIKMNGKISSLKNSEKYIAIKLSDHNETLDEELKGLNIPEIENIKYIDRKIFLVKFKKNIDRTIFKNKIILPTYNSEDEIPIIQTDKIIIKFKDGISKNIQNNILKKYNLKITYSFNYSKNAFLLISNKDSLKVSNKLFDLGIFDYAYPNFYIKHEKYFTPIDPLYSHQWHLNGNNINTNGVNAEGAWDINKGNSDIKIAILDDGLDSQHEDLNVVESYNFPKNSNNTGTKGDYFDSTNTKLKCTDNTYVNCIFGFHEDGNGKICETAPYSGCTFVESTNAEHGTACAGVAAAKGNNNKGVVGLCMECSILAYQTISSSGFAMADADIRAFEEAKVKADVVSCSWGYPKRTGTLTSINPALGDVINNVALTGRGGKGLPILFAAGNEGESFITDSLPGLQHVLAIGAINYKDRLTLYSNYGDNLFLVAPSNIGRAYGDEEAMYGIWTTDISGNYGYNWKGNVEQTCDYGVANCDNYTSTFGGTSSATPLTAGLVGLMLSQNNNLTLSQIRKILKNSATKISMIEEEDTFNQFPEHCDVQSKKNYNTEGHSICLGYGKIDALATMIATRDFNSEPTCNGILCSGHGDCSLDGGEPKCNCKEGYREVGLNCLKQQTDVCNGITCSNNGDCVEANGEPKCNCKEGFVEDGLNCIPETSNCSTVNCGDFGVCETKDNQVSCKCYEYFFNRGELYCYESCKDRSSNALTCGGHGECFLIDDRENGGELAEFCQCDAGYHEDGLNCVQDSVDHCANVNCGKGKCIVDNNQPKCNCDNGYHPENLVCVENNTTNPCDGVECGEGKCVVVENTPKCDCNLGYHQEGLNCIKDRIKNPCKDVVCSGHGICVINQGKALCNCDPNFKVQNKTQCVAKPVKYDGKESCCCSYNNNNNNLFLFLILTLLGAIFFRRKKKII